MLGSRRVGKVAVLALLSTVSLDKLTLAQAPPNSLQLTIPPSTKGRSASFEMELTSELTVGLEQASPDFDGVVRVYMFDDSGVLTALDDPETTSDLLAFRPPSPGRYFVVVLNTTSSPVTVRIRLVKTRGPPIPARNFAVVRVLFATTRQRESANVVRFRGDYSREVSYGFCDVSIPRDHRMGELEGPAIWRLELRETPERHVVLLATRNESETDFYEEVSKRISHSVTRQALVFVHGFNQTFDEAVKRTAQIAYDLAFDGPTIVFSWPSRGELLAYLNDQRNADLSAQALQDLLLRLKGTSRQITIHLIAHSMGNRVLTRALETLPAVAQGRDSPPLRELAMMAPDIDSELLRQVAPKIAPSAQRVTLYASSQDLAIQAAKELAGHARAGGSVKGLKVIPGVDTVDASSVRTSVLGVGHSYYADNMTILSDLFSVIRGHRPEERFGLERITSATGTYWRFRPAAR